MFFTLLCRVFWWIKVPSFRDEKGKFNFSWKYRRPSHFAKENGGQWHFTFLGVFYSEAMKSKSEAKKFLTKMTSVKKSSIWLFKIELKMLINQIWHSDLPLRNPNLFPQPLTVTLNPTRKSKHWFVFKGTEKPLQFSHAILSKVRFERLGSRPMVQGIMWDYVTDQRWFASARRFLIARPKDVYWVEEIFFDRTSKVFHTGDPQVPLTEVPFILLLPRGRMFRGEKPNYSRQLKFPNL